MLDSLIDKAQIFFGFNPDLTGNLTSVWIWYPIRRDLESYPLKKIVGIYYLEMELYYRTSEEKEEVNFVQLFDFSDYIDVAIPIRDVFEIV